MWVVFLSTIKQLFVLFLFMAIGFVLRRRKMVGEDFGKGLSKLELYLFVPFLTVDTFAKYCTRSVLLEKTSWVVTGTLLIIFLCIPVSRVLAKYIGKGDDEKSTYRYSLCFPNSGYLGYPIVSAVFGPEMLLNAMIFCIPYNIATYTYGMCVLSGENKFSWKQLTNPVTIAVLVGIAIGLSGIQMPEVVYTVLETGGGCMAPVAMLLTGHVLAGRSLKSQFGTVRVYVACVFRLILIPILTAVVLYLLGVRGDLFMISASLMAMPMGLNSIVVPEAYGKDATCGSQSTLISNLMGIITIPIMISIFSAIAF